MKSRGDRFFVFIIALAISFGVAFIGSLITQEQVESDWYKSIKPGITPPDFVFPAVWNILFFLLALSMTFSWIFAHTKNQKQKVIWVYGINLLLNLLWSFFYFGLHNPLLAFIDILALIISIVAIMKVNWNMSRVSFWLILPYLIWVCFAAVLNFLSI
ncbi:MAG: TspO/MBR family protein [Nanoarchaeota archaeon]|nr:TspO/MBR family protein [Nanoarchaeota archaeon]